MTPSSRFVSPIKPQVCVFQNDHSTQWGSLFRDADGKIREGQHERQQDEVVLLIIAFHPRWKVGLASLGPLSQMHPRRLRLTKQGLPGANSLWPSPVWRHAGASQACACDVTELLPSRALNGVFVKAWETFKMLRTALPKNVFKERKMK